MTQELDSLKISQTSVTLVYNAPPVGGANEVGFDADCPRCQHVLAEWDFWGTPQDMCPKHIYGA